MKIVYDLSRLSWELSGWIPYLWRFDAMAKMEVGSKPDAQVIVPASVPGSVQAALRDAGQLPDWNLGLNAQVCEWVENRHWIYETVLPDAWLRPGKTHRLNCLGLDYNGWVYLNGRLCGEFKGTHIPCAFELAPHLKESDNVLRIAFDIPPRWLGQFGYTSRMTEWKPRFNYNWDWQPRLVQLGIWDDISLEVCDGEEIVRLRCLADTVTAGDSATGILAMDGRVAGLPGTIVRLELARSGETIRVETIAAARFNSHGARWRDLPVELWCPNGAGAQPLYELKCTLVDATGETLDSTSRRVGFRHIEWQPCQGVPADADAWLCVVNGVPIFLQGVNFPPVRANFADVREADYRVRLELYRDLGANCLRLNACGFLEKEVFYDLCDELGLLVWQEFPLTSSGIENVPPNDTESIASLCDIARSFIARRQHHASLLLWSGGNELIDMHWRPCGTGHPMLFELRKVVLEQDPGRRYIPTSPSGPRMGADPKEFGLGLHHDVHGPWQTGPLQSWVEYYAADDALFRSEIVAPGTTTAESIRRYAGDRDPLPIDRANPLWRNPVAWWLEVDQYISEHGHEPPTLEAYVAWSRERQAESLVIAMTACKKRFPRCGGALLWTGHDSSPCPTNASIIDFEGEPKPAALALSKVWKTNPKEL